MAEAQRSRNSSCGFEKLRILSLRAMSVNWNILNIQQLLGRSSGDCSASVLISKANLVGSQWKLNE